MRAFLKCLAEAVAAKGVRGLVEWVPGGPYLFDVAADALKRLKQRRQHEELREDIRTAAEASFQDARAAAAQVVAEVAPDATPTDKIALELYLSQVPGAVRRSLRRADDPTGRTVPPSFALNTPDDLLKVLPPQMPRFRAGDDVPGRLGWKLVEPLGAGGFGEVWRVENEENGRTYAVKFCTDATARHRLLKHEKVLVKRVQSEAAHPHIVGLEDSLLLDAVEVPWLAYEYVGGGDLAGLILSWQALPGEERTRRALGVFAVLAETAGHFHRLNPPIVHRDLKPANILVDAATGRVRITDFGIGGIAAANLLSGSRDGATAYTRAVSMLSGAYTPIYASPQQQRGDPPDPRDDVHALGVIAYQMLTGRLDVGPGPKFERDLQKLSVPADVIHLIGDCIDPVAEDRVADGAAVAVRIRAGGAERREREAAEARAREEAQERLRSENFRRWGESGEPDRWVEERNGEWSHADWVALTDRLRASAYWPLPLEAVGEGLERAKRDRRERKAEELRRQAAREAELRIERERAEREQRERAERERVQREQRERIERERTARERAEREQREKAERERAARERAARPTVSPPPPAYTHSVSDGPSVAALVTVAVCVLLGFGLLASVYIAIWGAKLPRLM